MEKKNDIMEIEKSVDENAYINPEAKELVKECFRDIYQMLGKNNFKRWLYTKQASKKVRELVLDYLEVLPNNDRGNYTAKTNKMNIVTAGIEKRFVKKTAIHEIYHMLSYIRTLDRTFCRFLNEGITEYLTTKTRTDAKECTYYENVFTVAFLHKILGDNLIKAYLLGERKELDNIFANLIANDETSKSVALADVEHYYDLLENRREIVEYYNTTVHNVEASDEFRIVLKERGEMVKNFSDKIIEYIDEPDKLNKLIEEQRPLMSQIKKLEHIQIEIEAMHRRLLLGKVKQMAQNLEFYDDEGTIRFGKILSLLTLAKTRDPIFPLEKEKDPALNELMSEVAGVIFEHSHYAVGLDENMMKKRKEEFFRTVRVKNGRGGHIWREQSIAPQELSDAVSKLCQNQIENTPNINLFSFVDIVLKISNKFNLSRTEMDNLISQNATKVFGDEVDVPLIQDLIGGSMQRNMNLYKEEEQRKNNTVVSKFKMIGLNRYLEKRDNQYFYVRIDREGNLEEHPIIPELRRKGNGKFSLEFFSAIDKIEKENASVYNDFSYGNFSNVSDGMLDNLGTLDADEFRKLQLFVPYLEALKHFNPYNGLLASRIDDLFKQTNTHSENSRLESFIQNSFSRWGWLGLDDKEHYDRLDDEHKDFQYDKENDEDLVKVEETNEGEDYNKQNEPSDAFLKMAMAFEDIIAQHEKRRTNIQNIDDYGDDDESKQYIDYDDEDDYGYDYDDDDSYYDDKSEAENDSQHKPEIISDAKRTTIYETLSALSKKITKSDFLNAFNRFNKSGQTNTR